MVNVGLRFRGRGGGLDDLGFGLWLQLDAPAAEPAPTAVVVVPEIERVSES